MNAPVEFSLTFVVVSERRSGSLKRALVCVCEVTSRSSFRVAYSDVSSAAGARFWL